jgi:acyl-CoA synthetase (NDP forming)
MQVDPQRLARALNPKTLVVVGDKGPNFQWLENNKDFDGNLYSVQVDPNEIKGIEERGYKNFLKLEEVPEDNIDLVICAVPRNVAPFIVNDAVKTHVGGMVIFTAGFAETTEELGIQLQERIVEMAKTDGLPIVGPNCMGVHNGRLGVKFTADQPKLPDGNVSYITQSGTHGASLSMLSPQLGIKVTRTVSIGNAVVLNEADYLEYLRDDPDTHFIGMYLEGVKDGRRFFEVLRETVKTKPVVIWKGGQNEAGQRATRSHTASLATSQSLWDGMMRQVGAIPVNTLDEMLDVMACLVHNPPAVGPRVALMAMTGGQSVAISDAFGRANLEVPALSEQSYERLGEFFNIIGGSYRNPFDMAGTIGLAGDPGNLNRILDILAEDPNIDSFVYEFSAGFFIRQWSGEDGQKRLNEMLDGLDAFRTRVAQPLVLVVHPGHLEAQIIPLKEELWRRNYAVYGNFDRAAIALAKVTRYYEEHPPAK